MNTTDTTTTRPATTTDDPPKQPEAWVSCLHCYNSGRLVGDWFTLDELVEINIREVHRANEKRLTVYCEEYEVFDTEWLPSKFNIGDLQSWLEAWNEIKEIDPEFWSPFLAFVDWYGIPDTTEFDDAYCGKWESWREFAEHDAKEYFFEESASRMWSYFDFERWARDLYHDYTVLDAPGGGVYIFRDRSPCRAQYHY